MSNPASTTKLKLNKVIWVTDQFVAFHRWKEAPSKVAFLRDWHRHIFKVTIVLEVKHSERELEFYLIKDDVQKILTPWKEQSFNHSCETFAELIMQEMIERGYHSITSVEVSEDGENGAIVTRT